jgi:hypothetical protein
MCNDDLSRVRCDMGHASAATQLGGYGLVQLSG